MPTSTLRILREVNNFTQEFIAEDVLGVSQTTYARLEQSTSKITVEQAKKLADLYKVSIANLLSEESPVIIFQSKSISENTNSGNNGYIQNQTVQMDESTVKSLQEQVEFLKKQNADLLELVKVLGGKLAGEK